MDRETVFLRHLLLPVLNFVVDELFHFAAVGADQMVVMAAFVDLEYGVRRLEVAADQDASLLKLRQNSIDRRQPQLHALILQKTINVLGREVFSLALVKELQNSQPRQRCFEAGFAQFSWNMHSFIRAARVV